MKFDSKHGAILIAVTVFVAILAIAAASVMELSLSNNKLSQRNEYRARARAVAESELEYLYHAFSTKVTDGIGVATIGDSLAADGICDNANMPTTLRTPFLQLHLQDNAGNGWRVYRSFTYDTTIGTIFGTVPGTKKTGQYSYYNAKIIVRPPASSFFASNDDHGNDLYATNPADDPMAVRIGRRMTTSTTSIFQYNVFYQGDLEMAPGGNTVLDGDIASNGSAYLAASPGGSLTIKGQVRYLLSTSSDPTYFNKDASNVDVNFSHTLRKPGTFGGALLDPTFPLFDASANDYATSPANTQVETMTEKENLLGGADATDIAKRNPTLFGPTDTSANLVTALNNVYRSVLAPPPNASTASEYPYSADLSTQVDDVSIAALRLYNRALNNSGLIITIGASGAVESITKNGANITSGALWDAVTTSVVSNQGAIYDAREGKNIATTQVDVGALKTALDANYNGTDGTNAFAGILYVNLKNSTGANPAALRLVNGTTTPHPNFIPGSTDPVKGDPASSAGFSVATNGGLYVKGNYNTTPIVGAGNTFVNPAMLMGDAVTVLSDNWSDANASAPLSSRLAVMSSDTTFNGATMPRTMVIAAGILTGGVEATEYHPSGGAQNLVRYLEDWHQTGGTSDVQVQFYGSMGSLFDSRYFTSFIDSNGGVGSVYLPPSTRMFTFNSALKLRSPQGTPTITAFSRGNYFLWDSSGS